MEPRLNRPGPFGWINSKPERGVPGTCGIYRPLSWCL